jgi:integrase
MAYIRQRGKTWSYTVDGNADPRDPNKRNQITRGGFKDEREARIAAEKMEIDIAAGKRVDTPTLEKFITMFYETIVVNKVSEGTYQTQWIIATKYIIPKLGRFKLDKISAEQVDMFYNLLIKEGVSRGYIKNIAMVLSKTIKQAVTWNYVVKNVIKEASSPSYKPAKVEVWTEEELSHFLNVSRNLENHALYVLSATTGMRIGEVMSLNWKDIDVVKHRIEITKTLKYSKSKGLYIKPTPKTSNSLRTIVVPKSTIEALQEHKSRQLPDVEIVFDRFGKYVHPHDVWRSFVKESTGLGMKRMKLHGLRHTHATILLGKGFNAAVVAERLGDTVETVLRTYAHVLPSMQQEVADQLSNIYKSVDNFKNVVPDVVNQI